jgi:hypothetical protein
MIEMVELELWYRAPTGPNIAKDECIQEEVEAVGGRMGQTGFDPERQRRNIWVELLLPDVQELVARLRNINVEAGDVKLRR